MRNLFLNPVLNKEFKLRFRSFKSFLGLSFYLLALSIIIIGFIYIQTQNSPMGLFRPDQSKSMFMLLSFIQMGLILFITPGLTAGVISGEREKQTLNILLTTNQSSTSIILGKLISSVSFLLLMIIASMPIYSIVFLFGGISPGQVVTILGYYIFTILVFGSIGIFFSTLVRKTIIAMVSTYGVTLFLTAGTAFLFTVTMSVNQMGITTNNPVPYFFVMLNPIMILFGFLEPDAFRELSSQTGMGIDFPLWAANLISFTIIFLVMIFISIRKLRPNMKVKSKG
ncbi:ABC transporter permease [Neobacillus sp. WH10]|uniref:ABC transporter permease n=1 Tax=Neobacillus sp. WH10 TaxID=3047873 RepID=UPI0024C1C6B2|nr:ABC transporter permease subunit [Neobacillus sp. WH10]WHY79312.1 ABC transporter permease [Neobacillus sp. WH10]